MKISKEFITGYQWSPQDNKFMGEYVFPNNKDKEEIHMPPFTTLTTPPTCERGYCPYWDGNEWYVDVDPNVVTSHPPIDDYYLLMPDYIDYLKENDLWTDEDEIYRQKALKDAEDRELEEKRIEDELKRKEEEREKNRDFLSELRTIRHQLLTLCDWTHTIDAQNILTEEKINLWSIYRQSLRDLPQNINDAKILVLDLNNPNWPISPEGKTPFQIFNLN